MRISYLELRNYRRFRDIKVQFPDGIVGIVGMNGAGKTTLIEGIAWALFGNAEEIVRTSRESVKSVGSKTSDSCSALLEFELGGTEYRIEREMGGKSLSMKVSIRTGTTVLAEGDRDVKRAVEKLLGMDYKSFFTSVFARQKELNALQNVAAGERKKTVLRMLRIDGVDDVLQRVRQDRRGIEDKMRGAESTLLDQDGRDRESALRERMPGLAQDLEQNEALLRIAAEEEKKAAADLEGARDRRDELKRDSDAYNSASGDLSARASSLAELQKRSERIEKRLKEALVQVEKLPELLSAENQWNRVIESLEKLQEERRKHERAKALASDIEADRAKTKALSEDLGKAEKDLKTSSDLGPQREALEAAKSECESTRRTLIDKLGELRAKVKEREGASAKDKQKLDEISDLGKDGVCPTCERRLEDAYGLLVEKLSESSERARNEAEGARAEAKGIQDSLDALDRKEEALRKKARWLEQESGKAKKLEARVEGLVGQLKDLGSRVSSRTNELEGLGEIAFTPEVYDQAKAERDRLKPLRDEYMRLKGVEEEVSRLRVESKEVEERASRYRLEEEGLKRLVEELQPKKVGYEKALKLVDDKMNILSKAKDDARARTNKRDKSKADLDEAARELERIARVKKDIESDGKRKDDLAMLEDIMVSFKDHLINKVAPTLGELTSHVFSAMTSERYGRVELGEGYEILVDDDGELHPLGRFSGGESDLANLALRLAISRVIAERTGANQINLLILDEIFGSLDPSRKRSVMSAMASLSAQFRQIFLITHIEDIKDLMTYVMKVEQLEDGTSTVMLEA